MGHDFKFEVVSLAEIEDCIASNAPDDPEAQTVLIVDDEPLIVDSLAAILRTTGLKVQKAYGGLEAMELALRNPPDLLLTDVAMPGMNGIELALAVAQARPRCRILLFSAHASTLDLTPAREAGYDFSLLGKPIHPKEMLKHVFFALGEPAMDVWPAPARRERAPWQIPQTAM